MALPWQQYFDLEAAGGRRTHQPLPFLFAGDVISAHNLGFADGIRETRDQRELLLDAHLAGRAPSNDQEYEATASLFADLGIRWIANLPGGRDSLTTDPEIRRALELTEVLLSPDIELYEVGIWKPGADVSARRIPILASIGPSETGGTENWQTHGLDGWYQGIDGLRVSTVGTMEVAGFTGAIWFLPGVLVLGSDLAWLTTLVILVRLKPHELARSWRNR